jgi:hypothetical protein
MGSHCSFGHLKHKLWAKEGPGVKLAVDSRPLKVGNRGLPEIRFESATRRWKALDKGYNFASDCVAIGLCSREISASKVPRLRPGTISGLPRGSPGKNGHLDATPWRAAEYTIRGEGASFLPQGSKVVADSQARGVVCQSESEFTRGCPNTKRTRNEF